ncbi:MAG: nucleotidyltransferase domain-containing protein [Candidatus Hydrothermarchaeales archaeon]
MRVLLLFMKNPYERYYLRETARLLKMSPMTVKRSLDLLTKEKLLVKEKIKNQILYSANIESPGFRHLKIAYNLAWFEKKETVKFIKEMLPTMSSLVLYGSLAKGEDDEKSDVDFLVISQSKRAIDMELSQHLGREVAVLNLTPAQWSEEAKKNRGLYLDVITEGIVLYGTRPVVE